MHKQLRGIIHSGIRKPIDCPDKFQTGFTVQKNDTCFLSIFQGAMPELSIPGFLKLPNLSPTNAYRIEILIEPEKTDHLMKIKPNWMVDKNFTISGEWLSKKGLPLPVMDPESLIVLQLTEVVKVADEV